MLQIDFFLNMYFIVVIPIWGLKNGKIQNLIFSQINNPIGTTVVHSRSSCSIFFHQMPLSSDIPLTLMVVFMLNILSLNVPIKWHFFDIHFHVCLFIVTKFTHFCVFQIGDPIRSVDHFSTHRIFFKCVFYRRPSNVCFQKCFITMAQAHFFNFSSMLGFSVENFILNIPLSWLFIMISYLRHHFVLPYYENV